MNGTDISWPFNEIVRETGEIPLCWSGAVPGQTRIGIGAALNPLIVSWLSGRPVRRVAFNSGLHRLVAGGSIGQNLSGGEAWVWGTGCSAYVRKGGRRRLYRADGSTKFRILSTRGPIAGGLLGGGALQSLTFGDPLTLTPRLHPAKGVPKWELGVVPHPSDMTGLLEDGGLRAELVRYQVPPALADKVRLIDPATAVSVAAVRAWLDELLECKRILTASPAVLILAMSYSIPCLFFPDLGRIGPGSKPMTVGEKIDIEVQDFTLGQGRETLVYYDQPRMKSTDWEEAIAAIDGSPVPASIRSEELVNSFPADISPLTAPENSVLLEHPMLAETRLCDDPAEMRREEKLRTGEAKAAAEARRAAVQLRLRRWRVPATARPYETPPHLPPMDDGALPLSWAAGMDAGGAVNIGDALSPLIVAAISGRQVRHRAFDSPDERMAAVGTIGHGQRNGDVHFWGAGLDERAGSNEIYEIPDNTRLHVHAMRGPMSAGALRMRGVTAPEVYGDPVYFLPKILPVADVEITHDLGVVLHLSELPRDVSDKSPHGLTRARPEHLRYHIPRRYRDRVKLIDTRATLSEDGFRRKIAEIAGCRAILSTSLHGLVIADAYNVPNAWFAFNDHGLHHVDPLNPADRIDHRIRDLYAGHGKSRAQVFGARRDKHCDWDAAIGTLLNEIEPRSPAMRPLFDAFPGPAAVKFEDASWAIPSGVLCDPS